MARNDNLCGPSTRIERWTEQFLVRIITGIGMAVMFLVMTPLLLGALSPWWFAASAALGFIVGFVGSNAPGALSHHAPRRTRRGDR